MNRSELKKILDDLNWSQKKLANELGVRPSTVSMWLSGQNPITNQAEKSIRKIVGGNNNVIRDEESDKEDSNWKESDVIFFDFAGFLEHKRIRQQDLAERLEVQQPYISQLKREYSKNKPVPDGILKKMKEEFEDEELEPFLHLRKTYRKMESGTVIDMYSSMRPYYDIDFFGSPGMELLDPAGKIEPSNYISVPHFQDVDFYTRVTGDSMYPKYRHGDIIACKEINTSGFFAFYEPYAIVTRTNNQRLIKYIHPHPEKEDYLLLVSYDQNKYPPQPIERSEILKLFQIKGKIEL